MLGRLAAGAALIALAACAGLEPAGRNARAGSPETVVTSTPPRAPAPEPVLAAPPPQVQSSAPTSAAAPAPAPVAAPSVTVATPAPAPRRVNDDDDTVTVPGQVERQVPAPAGDPRSASERMQDINSWDRCVTNVQAAYERDPMRPQLSSPEEYCSQSLGMSSRNAVPESRRQR